MSRILKVRLNHCNIFTTVQGSVIRNVSSTGSLIDNFDATHVAKPFEDIPGPRSFPFIGPLLNFLPGQFDVTILASDCVNDLYEEKYSAPSGPSLNLLFSIQVVYAVASENSKCQTMQTHESLGGLRGVELARTLHNKYGNIVKVGGFCGNEGLVWLFDPNTIEHVYRSENAMPVRPSFASLDYYRQRHNKVYDPDRFTGLASDHGEKWWEFRSKVNPVMLQPKTIILYKNVLADVTNDMIARIRSMREEKDMIKKNFYREMTLWALESVGVVALGTRLHCFDPKNSASKDLIRTVHELFEVVDKLDVGLSPWRYISTPKFRKAMKIFEEQEGLTKFFVDKAVQNMQENKGKNIETNDHEKPILEKLLEIDYDIAHVMAADMLIAGVDTASNTSIAALYFLANNPEKQNKLREEVLSQRTSYPYLWATIKESLRLMPPVYANVRLTTKEYNLLGFKIPKNVKLLFPHQFLSTSEKHYPRAGEFIPERWLVNKEDPLYYGNVHPFVNAPFGFGTRVCIGVFYGYKGLQLSEQMYKRYGPIMKLEGMFSSPNVIMLFDANTAEQSANTSLATLYLLAKNPEEQKKLREEILSKQTRSPYLRACIKESMRMLPVVHANARLTTKEYNLLEYKIPKDMSIMEEDYPKPDEFIPERWIADKDDPLYHGLAHPFANAPFGYGVRMNVAVSSASVNNNSETPQSLKLWRDIPGPKSLSFIGTLLHFLPGGELHGCIGIKLFRKLYDKYGPIVRMESTFGQPPTIMLFDANAVEYVLRNENSMPIRPGSASLEYYRKHHNKIYDPDRQTGLVSDHGKNWKDLRSKVNHILLEPKHIKLYSEAFEGVSDDMISRIRSIRDENNMITKKFDVEMNLWALESIGVVALGTRLHCLDPNQPEDSEARKLMQNIRNILAILEKVDVGPSPWKYFSTPNFKRAMAYYEEQERLTNFFIDKAINKMKVSVKKENKSDGGKSILQEALRYRCSAGIKDGTRFGHGRRRYAMATLYLLAKNPEKQNLLREEVLAKPKRRAYLRACIKESMRMLPIVGGNARLTTKEYNLLGYKIPKNQMLLFVHQHMSNMEEHYPKPEEFIPERWTVGKDDPLYQGNAHPFAYAPFGFGVRMCIGLRIVELEIETFISKVVANFDIGWEGAPLNVAPTTLNFIKEPFGFIFKDYKPLDIE